LSYLPEERDVVQKLLGSDTKLEILELFHRNPGLVDKIDGVSRRIGRDAGEIEADVRDLVDIGVLRTETSQNLKVISYDQKNDARIENEISYRLMKGFDSRKS